jgi:hypothetical protein
MAEIEIEDYEQIKHASRKTIADQKVKIGNLAKDNSILS